jgi:large repetitive protein
VPSFSGDCSSGIVLPVEIISFYAICQLHGIEIIWQTASEQNNSHFIIEKSHDALIFNPIGIIKGKGNSNIEVSYSFTDNHIQSIDNYYRLKQVDYDGNYQWSNAIYCSSACNATNESKVLVFFNKEFNELIVSYYGSYVGIAQFEIIDITGKTLYRYEIYIDTENFSTIFFTNLPSSIYLYSLTYEKNQYNNKFIVN